MMRHSLFLRFLSSVLLVVLLTLAIMSFATVSVLRRENVKQKQEMLHEQARDVASMLTQRESQSLWSVTTAWDRVINNKIETICANNDVKIWLVDRNGFVATLFSDDTDIAPRLRDENVLGQLRKVLSGAEIQVQGLFPELGGQVVTVGVPWRDPFGKVLGAVLLHTDVSNLEVGLRDIGKEIFITAIGALLLGLALSYLVTRSITKPIVRIDSAMEDFASGKLDSRVTVNRKDELGRLAGSFNSMAQDISTLEEQRRSFVANVSHELRSPMTSIQGYVQGMLDGTVPDEERERYLTVVLSETKRLNKLISELLDLSRIESGKFPLKLQKFDINEMLARIMFQYESRIEEKHINVDISFKQEKCMVCADPDRISQVIVNLIDNAVKFLNEDGNLLVWTLQDEEHTIVTINNDGPLISREDLPYIFDRFYKADKSHSGRGTGLGLSIVKKILVQHGQDIRCTSAEGHGTSFIFTLANAGSEDEDAHGVSGASPKS